MASVVWNRLCSGVYDSEDGRFTMYRIEGVYPPAWNVEWAVGHVAAMVDADPEHVTFSDYADCIVDGAISMRVAREIAQDEISRMGEERS